MATTFAASANNFGKDIENLQQTCVLVSSFGTLRNDMGPAYLNTGMQSGMMTVHLSRSYLMLCNYSCPSLHMHTGALRFPGEPSQRP